MSEVRDALGEMANRIGGNFKSLLEPPVQLSLPSVTEGVGYKVLFPGCSITNKVNFQHGEDGLNVTSLTREAQG
ncbi:MAG: chemotaxis protein CheX [Planctomycetota bacterium]